MSDEQNKETMLESDASEIAKMLRHLADRVEGVDGKGDGFGGQSRGIAAVLCVAALPEGVVSVSAVKPGIPAGVLLRVTQATGALLLQAVDQAELDDGAEKQPAAGLYQTLLHNVRGGEA